MLGSGRSKSTNREPKRKAWALDLIISIIRFMNWEKSTKPVYPTRSEPSLFPFSLVVMVSAFAGFDDRYTMVSSVFESVWARTFGQIQARLLRSENSDKMKLGGDIRDLLQSPHRH